MRSLTFFFLIFVLVQCKKDNEPEVIAPVFIPFQKGKTIGSINGQPYIGDTYCVLVGSGDNRKLVFAINTYNDTIDFYQRSAFIFTPVPFKIGKYNTTDSIICRFSLVYSDGDVLGPTYEPDSLYTAPSISIDSISPSGKMVSGSFNALLRKSPHLAHLAPSAPDSMNFVNCSFQVIVDEK